MIGRSEKRITNFNIQYTGTWTISLTPVTNLYQATKMIHTSISKENLFNNKTTKEIFGSVNCLSGKIQIFTVLIPFIGQLFIRLHGSQGHLWTCFFLEGTWLASRDTPCNKKLKFNTYVCILSLWQQILKKAEINDKRESAKN